MCVLLGLIVVTESENSYACALCQTSSYLSIEGSAQLDGSVAFNLLKQLIRSLDCHSLGANIQISGCDAIETTERIDCFTCLHHYYTLYLFNSIHNHYLTDSVFAHGFTFCLSSTLFIIFTSIQSLVLVFFTKLRTNRFDTKLAKRLISWLKNHLELLSFGVFSHIIQ